VIDRSFGKARLRVITLTAAALLYWVVTSLSSTQEGHTKKEFFRVTRVIDGDTLQISNGEKVRLIGVDTPEARYNSKLVRDARRSGKDMKVIEALGRRASSFTKKLCAGRNVRLDFDVEKRDKYKRLLAYVYLEDGTFVNAKIVEEGYGEVMTVPPNVKFADTFAKLQKEARENNRGLWGK